MVDLIVARSYTAAHRFAQEDLGMAHGTYRVVTNSGTIKAIRGANVHLAPDWERRFDMFSVKQALKWSHHNIIDHALSPNEDTEEVSPNGDSAKRVRRKRCDECGDLILPDEFEQHVAEHE